MSYSDRVVEAFRLAADLHRDQVRKGGSVPYLNHLMAVASLVGSAGGSEDEVIAALLHDAVEDQGGLRTLERIRHMFGDRVADIVEGCSDAFETPKPPWRARKEAFLARLENASEAVRRVVCADKLDNARALLADLRLHGEVTWSKFRGGKEGTIWAYRAAAETLREGGAPPRLLDDLDETIDAILERAHPGRASDAED